MLELELQLFGGRGAGSGRKGSAGSATPKTYSEQIKADYEAGKGKSVNDLKEYFSDLENIRKEFDLYKATTDQLWAIKRVLYGMAEYDYTYGDKKPFLVKDIKIKHISNREDDEENRRIGMTVMKDITISITTAPDIDNDYIRYLDTKHRHALIGSRGGYYTYNKNAKRTNISQFDINYGKKL